MYIMISYYSTLIYHACPNRMSDGQSVANKICTVYDSYTIAYNDLVKINNKYDSSQKKNIFVLYMAR